MHQTRLGSAFNSTSSISHLYFRPCAFLSKFVYRQSSAKSSGCALRLAMTFPGSMGFPINRHSSGWVSDHHCTTASTAYRGAVVAHSSPAETAVRESRCVFSADSRPVHWAAATSRSPPGKGQFLNVCAVYTDRL